MKLKLKPEELSLAEQFSILSDQEQVAYLERLYDSGRIDSFLKSWEFWGRPEQQLPPGNDWDTLLILAGRGSGKTRMCAEMVHTWAENRNWHISLVGETVAEVRDVMVEGSSGLMMTAKPWNPCEYNPSKRRVVWPKTGTWATTYSGDSPDQLRGPNSQGAWLDELAKFRYAQDVWDNLMMVLRVGIAPKCIVSTTPRPIPLIKELFEKAKDITSGVLMRTWSTYRNIANLSARFIQNRIAPYEGTRYGRQELYAELLTDVPGALWNLGLLESTRVKRYPDLSRIVIGIDPAASSTTETGIVVAGLGRDGHGYVLDDVSLASSPGGWGAQVVLAYDKYKADRACAEANNGGDMVISTIETAAKAAGIPVATKKLHASRGKYARAEPVAALYEQGRVHHVGMFAKCEDELTNWIPGEGLASPNRLDALVWALTELMLTGREAPIISPVMGSHASIHRV
jgi:phage terminase large subunit-like protein